MMNRVISAATVLAIVAAPALAKQTPPPQQTTPQTAKQRSAPPAQKAMADSTFVTKAAQGGMAEVEFGKLATEKASSDSVKQFGQRMVDDHSKANDELKSLAQQKNMTLPTEMNAKDKAEQDQLLKLSGEAFDRAYMRMMVEDHRRDVNEFRNESKAGKDPEVKAWAAKTLPTLEDHLKMAQETNRAVGTSGKK